MQKRVTVIGGGLAGCEAAWQLAGAGLDVRLVDMKPTTRTPAQHSDNLAELVCSNSLRSANLQNAVGLLKEEMRRLGSLIIRAALATRVAAGDALAVDREAFGALVTSEIENHPRITRSTELVSVLPSADAGETIIATGPLTADALATELRAATGNEQLYFYDAIAPIVSGDSIDRNIAFAASRYGKGNGDDYLNCPMDREQYQRFLSELLAAECAPLHSFEQPNFFEGCLPLEVVAERGADTLRFGCMKPVGLEDPRTGRRAYAVLQLRREDQHGQAFNLVGCQTKLKHDAQRRLFRMIPGLEQAVFLRLGAVHRNTYVNSPVVLDQRMRLQARPNLRLAGQITGVEGYVESAAHGLLTALLLASDLREQPVALPPPSCALGALAAHVTGTSRLAGRHHEPQNVHWGLFEPLAQRLPKRERKQARTNHAITAFEQWSQQQGLDLLPRPADDLAAQGSPAP